MADHRDLQQRILRSELANQCWLAERSETLLAEALKRPAYPPDPRISPGIPTKLKLRGDDPKIQYAVRCRTDVWTPIQTILQSAAIASHMLWPGQSGPECPELDMDPDLAERRNLILEGIVLPDLPNLRSKRSRNAIVHVEDWALRWMRARLNADPEARLAAWACGTGGPPRPNTFRWLNVETWELGVAGDVCNLRQMIEELRVLRKLIPTREDVEFNLP
jgi:hypothetical protein